MYTVDGFDTVLEIKTLPYCDSGAPMPVILADDHNLLLGYITAPDAEQYVVLKFMNPIAHYFGSPNDEALPGHPLAKHGVTYYGIFEIKHSSWIRALERMNRVHPLHDPRRYETLRHFILCFHDDTFECIARDVAHVATIEMGDEVHLPSLMVSHLR